MLRKTSVGPLKKGIEEVSNMEAIRLHKVVDRAGELVVKGLPYKKGQHVELILLIEHPATAQQPHMTAQQLLNSELIGLWKDREGIEESCIHARQLREQAQKREVKK